MAEWYYTTNNQQMGPVSWDELRQLASTGLLHPNDMVWKEGMSEWLKANKKDGLFSSSPGRGESSRDLARADDPPLRRSRERDRRDRDDRDRDDRGRDDRGRDERRRDDYDDDYDDRPRRRRSNEGMPIGAKVAIIGGSIVVGLVIVVVVIVLLVRGSRGGGGNVPLGPNAYRITLFDGQENVRMFRFNQGQLVRITVNSQADIRTDVDLYVELNNRIITADTRISKDCFVQFVAPATDTYRVKVRNLGRGMATSDVTVQ